MKILFLDIDGVLGRMVNGAPAIEPACVAQLNRIIAATSCKVVLSSSWRELLYPQDGERADMTLSGFSYMLHAHGVRGLELIDKTERDDERETATRGQQIRRWMTGACIGIGAPREMSSYVALDDCDDGITRAGIPLIRTDDRLGLTEMDSERVIEILGASAAPESIS